MLVSCLTEPDLELREEGAGDGWTVRGIAVPWLRKTEPRGDLGGLREEFVSGAFDSQVPHASRVVLGNGHLPLGGKLIGRLDMMRNDSAGLYVEGRISATRDGQDARTLVGDKVLDRFSIGFKDGRSRRAGDTLQRITGLLREVALVPNPAYADAVVMGLRAGECPTCAAAAVAVPEEEPVVRVRSAEADQIVAQAAAQEALIRSWRTS